MAQGKVKWFNDLKGFGFIENQEGREVFVHYTSIHGDDGGRKSLREGEWVEYDLYDGPKGLQAKNVVARTSSL